MCVMYGGNLSDMVWHEMTMFGNDHMITFGFFELAHIVLKPLGFPRECNDFFRQGGQTDDK